MGTSDFGVRIRELRRQAHMNQREVAAKVGIDFTYLSKIESGAMPPPSEDKIRKLANVFGADEYELITLAGKVPQNWKQLITQDKDVLKFLRAYKPDKTAGEKKE